MKKPQPKTRTVLDYNDCAHYIEKKYKKELRNWLGHRYDLDGKDLNNPPYRDFWHFLCDNGGVSNGGTIFISKEMGEDRDGDEAWIKEIVDIFVSEFGDEQEYETNW